jgi:F-type H+-transporting ATPase subunit b
MTEFLNITELAKGGLFDFGATLPFLMIQFILLTFVLNLVLYSPRLKITNERNNYILDLLNKANNGLEISDLVLSSNQNIIKTQQIRIKNFFLGSEKLYEQIWSNESRSIKERNNDSAESIIYNVLAENRKKFETLEENFPLLEEAVLYKTIFNPQKRR